MLSPLRNRAGKRLREPFGKAGLTVAVIALVFAMLGGAYAATNNSGGGKATASAKAKRGPRGPKGPAGPAGAVGPAGPQGSAGANGKDGTNGTNGKDGANGKDGTNGAPGADGNSVEAFPFPGNGEPTEINGSPVTHPCKEQGGAIYEVEGSGQEVLVCNGKEGKDGKEGSPWTAGGTLPPGATEAGVWSFQVAAPTIKVDVEGTTEELTIGPTAFVPIAVPISFPIKFPFELKGEGCGEPEGSRVNPCHLHYGVENSGGAFVAGSGLCPGNTNDPQAAPGELCVYHSAGSVSGTSQLGIWASGVGEGPAENGANPAGTYIGFASNTGPARGTGSYAITGCTKTVQVPPNPAIECPPDS